jgi:CspA family cold shock protein
LPFRPRWSILKSTDPSIAGLGGLAEIKSLERRQVFSMTGSITKLIADRRFGFIRDEGGQEVFFHASVVAEDGFHSLTVGQAVSFDLARGDKGPKAMNVRPQA